MRERERILLLILQRPFFLPGLLGTLENESQSAIVGLGKGVVSRRVK